MTGSQVDEGNTFLFTPGVLIRLFCPLSNTSVLISSRGGSVGLFRSFDLMDEISYCNLHMNVKGDDGKTYGEQQLSFCSDSCKTVANAVCDRNQEW